MENVMGHILRPREGALKLLSFPAPPPAKGWMLFWLLGQESQQ